MRNARFLLRYYLMTVLIFVVAKLVFMLCNHAAMPTLTVTDAWQVVKHGLSLDLSTALYFIIVPYLCYLVAIWWPRRMLATIVRIYTAIISIAFALAFVADTSLYEFWKFKLDASCLEYLTTPTEAMASVTTGYLVVRFIVFVVVAGGIYGGFGSLGVWESGSLGVWESRSLDNTSATEHTSKLPNSQTPRLPNPHTSKLPDSQTPKLLKTLASLLLIPIIIIGIRGGVDESTTNIGQVYFSQNQFLNHSAVNPVFSFLASFEKSSSEVVTYHFMDDDECHRLTDGLFSTESIGTDSLLTTRTPNIVIILLESMGGEFTDIGGRTDVTPRFNQLTREGIYFSNCYANSWRTDRGTVCTWSGYPSFPTMSVMKMPSKTRLLPNLASTLRDQRGYQTHYLYGGDINFTNMRSYLISGGFEQLTWKTDYSSEQQRSAQWGVRDDITFQTALDMIGSLGVWESGSVGVKPLLLGYSTLSSHEPWDVPIHHFDDPVLNAFYYLDQCVGNFIDSLRQSPAWQNTLVIMLPDHGINYQDIDQTSMLKNHIPMLWLGGVVREPREVSTICNQTDLPATLLAQLGLPHDEFPYSRDVLSQTYTHPLAYHTYRNGYALLDSTGYIIYDLDANRVTASQTGDTKPLERLGKALLQLTTQNLSTLGAP